MKIIQAISQDGDYVGLYYTERDDDKVVDDVEQCFVNANEIAALDDGIDVQDAADTYLEEKGISRIFPDEAYINL